jgi:16S rRNA (adenine1518-N6/adenine1519-N6)-dimethyltransferase
MRPRKRFGQHFLTDRSVIDRIVSAVAPQPEDIVVEIGPGQGALTGPLAERLRHLHVIEIDRDLARALAARFSPERVTVHVGDALDFDFARLPSPLRLVGNLPYNISTPLLFRLIPFAARIRDAHFMLQLEVVERMVARPSTAEYGRLSVMLQYRFAMERIARVRPGAFHPAPMVESAVVRMVPLPEHALGARDVAVLSRVVTAAFTKRRKTLRNALAGITDAGELAALGIDPQLRPENLAVADYVGIANAVAARGADGSEIGLAINRAR